MLKKKLKYIIALFVLSIASIGASPVIRAEIDNAIYDINDIVTVKIRVDENPGIKGLFFDLSYDSQKLSFMDLSQGLMLQRVSEDNKLLYAHSDSQSALGIGGHLVVSWFMENKGDKTGENGTFAEIRFRVKARGVDDEAFQFTFSNNRAIDNSAVNLDDTIWENSHKFILSGSGEVSSVNIVSPKNNEVFHGNAVNLNATYSIGENYTLVAENTTTKKLYKISDISSGVLEDYPIDLIDGSNQISLKLFDSHNKKIASDQINLVKSNNNKYIKIKTPVDHALVNTNMVMVKVSSSFEKPRINGIEMKSLNEVDPENNDNKIYYYNLFLKEGFNTIRCEVNEGEENDSNLYKAESTIYYHKDDSIFNFVTPGADSVLKVKEGAIIPI